MRTYLSEKRACNTCSIAVEIQHFASKPPDKTGMLNLLTKSKWTALLLLARYNARERRKRGHSIAKNRVILLSRYNAKKRRSK